MKTDNQATALKFNLKKILIILMIIIAIIIGIIVSFSIACRPYDRTNNRYVAVEIKDNYSVEDIASKLNKKHIIGSKSKFVTLTKLLVHGREYKPGTYYLSPVMDFMEIAKTLTDGISTNEGFVLPSGYTVKQTAKALEQAGLCKMDDFMLAAESIDFTSFDFIGDDIYGADKLEGFLYPTRYTIGDDINAVMLIMNMLNEFDNIFTDEYRARAEELNLSIRDIVIIASMIEKETADDSERAELSAVIHNKLNLGIPFDGGYPEAPLCSPGLESIKAALYPVDSENIYFVHSDKLDGSHVFTNDKDEFAALTAAYEAALQAKKDQLKDQEDSAQ